MLMHPPIPPEFALTPVSRWPTILPDDSIRTMRELDLTGLAPQDSAGPPDVSVVIVSHDNRDYLTLCLRSVLAHSDSNCEVIVVDNGSTDGTGEELRRLAARDRRVQVVSNPENRGFAAATNQGVDVASGTRLILLNDDTIVPPLSLRRLLSHLDADPSIALVGAVTNRAGNEAQLETAYRTYAEMLEFAERAARLHAGQRFDIRTATMFCVAMRADRWRQLGGLDEQFEIGMFEDDDYAMRARAAGCRVVCAEDAFVHHFGQCSLGKLAATGEYGRLFHANRRRWESKWQRAWEPYQHRATPAYDRMLQGVRQLVDQHVPAGATIVVASKGDEALLRFGGRKACHFPQAAGGAYAGYHPADSEAAIRQLDELRRGGSRFFVLPSHMSWWLNHYSGFRDHLETSYSVVTRHEDAGVIYALEPRR